MTFDVPVSSVGRRQQRAPLVAAGAALLLVAGAALLTSGSAAVSTRPVAGDRATIAPVRPSGQFRVVTVGASVDITPELPESIDCPDLDRRLCLRVARAALLALPPDAAVIRDMTVWKSLLCGDELECPHHYLDGSMPLGSAVIRFSDEDRRIAINVVEWRHGDGIRLGPRAWLARAAPNDESD
jgi:hypothetical protein